AGVREGLPRLGSSNGGTPMSEDILARAERAMEGVTEGSLYRYTRDFRGERSHSVKSESGMVRAFMGYGPDGGTAYTDAEFFAAAPALVTDLLAALREALATIGKV